MNRKTDSWLKDVKGCLFFFPLFIPNPNHPKLHHQALLTTRLAALVSDLKIVQVWNDLRELDSEDSVFCSQKWRTFPPGIEAAPAIFYHDKVDIIKSCIMLYPSRLVSTCNSQQSVCVGIPHHSSAIIFFFIHALPNKHDLIIPTTALPKGHVYLPWCLKQCHDAAPRKYMLEKELLSHVQRVIQPVMIEARWRSPQCLNGPSERSFCFSV